MSQMGDNAIFQEQKIQEFSHNSYDDVGVFILTVVLPQTVTLIDRSLLYIGRMLINLIIPPSKCSLNDRPTISKIN
jgi:hypothetical protein